MPEKDDLYTLSLRLHALALFRGLLVDLVFSRLLRYLDGAELAVKERVDAYCAFVAALYAEGGDLGAYLLRRVLEDENAAVRRRATGKELPATMEQCLKTELALFSELSRLQPKDLQFVQLEEAGADLPAWKNTPGDFDAVYHARLAQVSTCGYGVFAAYHMFTLEQGAALLPVRNPDTQTLAELTGYEREREQVLINTKALLAGLPANNILLYGDAGTGKSSTVKAIVNEYRQQGLRLVEVRKNQLYQIPLLMDSLAENPLKFILFIDDLSFTADDGDFTELKAILEGNVSARPHNIVVYATSNRRHMVKERFSARQSDDLHPGDTLEEEASLSARFGLTITFLKPDRDLYAQIVLSLAAEYGLVTPKDALVAKSEAHALRHGGRSPRTARQFVEYMKAVEETGRG